MSKGTLLIHGIDGQQLPMNLIYGLIDPRTRLIRYIGQSSVGVGRPKQHAKSRVTTYCRNWIKKLQQAKLTYEIVVLDVLDDASELDELECWWIAFGKACDWPLTNLTDGGMPSVKTLTRRSERQKRKIERAAQRADARRRKAEERQRVKDALEAESIERVRKLRSMLYSPGQLAAVERRQQESRRPQQSPAEIEGRCFELFETHTGSPGMFIEVVIGARVTPATARWLYEKWLTSRSRGLQAMRKDHKELRTRLALECLRNMDGLTPEKA